jgi:hypothetical protein
MAATPDHSAADRPVYSFISCNLDQASDRTGLSVRELQRAIAAGDLVPNYRGTKPLLRAEELAAWVRSLPNEPRRR